MDNQALTVTHKWKQICANMLTPVFLGEISTLRDGMCKDHVCAVSVARWRKCLGLSA
jgi:hypothetical protein